jgi:hypothetical protein
MCMQAERLARREETRIAAASVGFYRAAVIHHSPGLQPWVNCTKGHALKAASEVVLSAFGVGLVDGDRCWYDCWNQYVKVLNPALGRHFQGASSKPRNPGLKPCAVLFTPFGGKPTHETPSDR